MMHDREKSHSAIVAAKPTNKAGSPAAELVEQNASEQSTQADPQSGPSILSPLCCPKTVKVGGIGDARTCWQSSRVANETANQPQELHRPVLRYVTSMVLRRAPSREAKRCSASQLSWFRPNVAYPLRNPIAGIARCCASATSGHVTTVPPRSVMNSRRLTRSPRRRARAGSAAR
jgi:hypothetical protein